MDGTRASVAVAVLMGVLVLGLPASSEPHLQTRGASGPAFAPAFQRGVCFSHNHSLDRGYGSDEATRSLAAVRGLGATHVSIHPTGYSFNVQHPAIFGYRGEDLTLTEERLRKTIRDAHAAGLKVALNPHLWVGVHWGQGDWRGDIRMRSDDDWRRWFDEYRAFILYFAKIAQDEGVALLVVGSELQGSTLTKPEMWRAVIREVRGVFKGACTYSANWGGEFEEIAFWDELEYLGISAYFPLADEKGSGIESRARELVARLQRLHARTRKPILFVESGFQSQPGAGLDPSKWSWNSRARVDLDLQRTLYDVWMRTFWQEPWFAGVYWWQWFSDASYSGVDDNSYVFRGKPAEAVVKTWFAKPAGMER
jgi:hypothetical protein